MNPLFMEEFEMIVRSKFLTSMPKILKGMVLTLFYQIWMVFYQHWYKPTTV